MKKTLTTLALATVLAFGTTFANAGIIVAGVASNDSGDPCTETSVDNSGTGIIVAGFTGIIVAGFTGIIVAGYAGDTSDKPQLCGIIVAG